MDNPLVSIIINNYNYGRFLRHAIDSALSQTYQNIEVMVVDDGSTDDSREIIASYGNKITPILKENGGQASAFNAGFYQSNGVFIIFLDSDDELLECTVKLALDKYLKSDSKVAVIQYRLKIINSQGEDTGETIPGKGIDLLSGNMRDLIIKYGPLCPVGYNPPPTSGNMFARSVLEKVMPVPEQNYRICADTYLLMCSPLLGNVLAINDSLGLYRVHGSNNYYSTFDINKLYKAVEQYLISEQDLMDFLKNHNIANRVTPWNSLPVLKLKLFAKKTNQLKSSDTLLKLVVAITICSWNTPSMRFKRRVFNTLWAWIIALSPVNLARYLIEKRYK